MSQERDQHENKNHLLTQTYLTVDFKAIKFSNFISKVTGLSKAEVWGRWTDSDIVSIHFVDPLPVEFSLILNVVAFGPNIGKSICIKIDNQVKDCVLTEKMQAIELLFQLSKPGHTIEVTLYLPISPKELNQSDDDRKIAIGIESLTIKASADILLKHWKQQVNHHARRTKELQEQLKCSQMNACRSEEYIKALLSSTSWRITKPLRIIKRYLILPKYDLKSLLCFIIYILKRNRKCFEFIKNKLKRYVPSFYFKIKCVVYPEHSSMLQSGLKTAMPSDSSNLNEDARKIYLGLLRHMENVRNKR